MRTHSAGPLAKRPWAAPDKGGHDVHDLARSNRRPARYPGPAARAPPRRDLDGDSRPSTVFTVSSDGTVEIAHSSSFRGIETIQAEGEHL